MNGTSAFREVESTISRSPWYGLLQEQRHRFGKGPDTIFMSQLTNTSLAFLVLLWRP